MVSLFRGKLGDAMSWAKQRGAVGHEWAELNVDGQTVEKREDKIEKGTAKERLTRNV
jgi:hypothetical protein